MFTTWVTCIRVGEGRPRPTEVTWIYQRLTGSALLGATATDAVLAFLCHGSSWYRSQVTDRTFEFVSSSEVTLLSSETHDTDEKCYSKGFPSQFHNIAYPPPANHSNLPLMRAPPIQHANGLDRDQLLSTCLARAIVLRCRDRSGCYKRFEKSGYYDSVINRACWMYSQAPSARWLLGSFRERHFCNIAPNDLKWAQLRLPYSDQEVCYPAARW